MFNLVSGMTTTIAVINKSSLLSDADGLLMTKACQYQMTYHASKLLGRAAWKVVYVPKGGTAPATAFPLVLLDDPDQANALGYHTEDPDGKVWGRVFVRPVLSHAGTALRGSMSVSAVLSHEVLETFVDRSVNYWADRMDGQTMVALEVADPVENDAYDVLVADATGVKVPVAVSNFVCDAWFDPQAAAATRRDWMKTTPGPMLMSSGGYIVVLNYNTGQVDEVFGSKEAREMHEAKKPAHEASRKARRHAKYGRH